MFTNMLTMGEVLPWMVVNHACIWARLQKGRVGASAHKALLYKIVDSLGKMNETIQDVLRALYFPYCIGPRLIWPLASRTS